MPDSLYLSLWFPTFRAEEMLARALAVLQQFPFAAAHPGMTYLAVQPISWAEPSLLELGFVPPVTPQEAVEAARDFAHDDYALIFEAYWELWIPVVPGGPAASTGASHAASRNSQAPAQPQSQPTEKAALSPQPVQTGAAAGPAWTRQESKVTFILHGTAFDEGIYAEHGHIEIDFGLDYHFLYEELDLSPADQQRVRDNVAQLIAFIQVVEKHCGLTGRVLWSESEANLAQKLVARLQRIQ
jgi:hypothetical protein